MNRLYFIWVFILCILFVGCGTPTQRQNKQISTLIYSQREAFKKHRYDIAAKLNTQLTILVPAPKKVADINSFKAQSWGDGKGIFEHKELIKETEYSVLPEDAPATNVVTNGSPEFEKILADNPKLSKLEQSNTNQLNTLEKKTETIQREKEAIVMRGGSSGSFFTKAFSFIKTGLGLGLIGTIIFLGLCAWWAPTMLPTVLQFIGLFISWMIKWVISSVEGIWLFLQALFKKKSG